MLSGVHYFDLWRIDMTIREQREVRRCRKEVTRNIARGYVGLGKLKICKVKYVYDMFPNLSLVQARDLVEFVNAVRAIRKLS